MGKSSLAPQQYDPNVIEAPGWLYRTLCATLGFLRAVLSPLVAPVQWIAAKVAVPIHAGTAALAAIMAVIDDWIGRAGAIVVPLLATVQRAVAPLLPRVPCRMVMAAAAAAAAALSSWCDACAGVLGRAWLCLAPVTQGAENLVARALAPLGDLVNCVLGTVALVLLRLVSCGVDVLACAIRAGRGLHLRCLLLWWHRQDACVARAGDVIVVAPGKRPPRTLSMGSNVAATMRLFNMGDRAFNCRVDRGNGTWRLNPLSWLTICVPRATPDAEGLTVTCTPCRAPTFVEVRQRNRRQTAAAAATAAAAPCPARWMIEEPQSALVIRVW